MFMQKEERLKNAFWILVLIIIIITSFYALFIEPNNLIVKRTELNLGLDESIKIVFISDIHIEMVSDDFLLKTIEIVNGEHADYIFLGGDFADAGTGNLKRLEHLSDLKAKKGVYAVLGNHDYSVFACNTNSSYNEISEFLSLQEITVLRNEKFDLEDFTLVGIDELWACKSNYSKAMENVNYSRAIIVLTHNSDAIPEYELEKLNLVLSGHTHCGQVRLPVIGSPLQIVGLISKYDEGLHQFDNDSYLYTTCGISGGPRFLAPPEVSVIEVN
jgi:predicted MPP superfamily phosphohydrolase